MCEYDVTALTPAELEASRRELAVSLALARPGSPVCAPIQAHLAAIDAELAERVAARPGLPGSPAHPAPGRRAGELRRDAPAPKCRGVLTPGAAALLGSPGPVGAAHQGVREPGCIRAPV
jgi:hypothetical protein